MSMLGERDWKVMALLDLDPAAEGLNCKTVLYYSDRSGKIWRVI